MSLLEDVFLEDEADEARDLERVIEGDEYENEGRAGSDGSGDDDDDNVSRRGDDEAEEEKRKVDPQPSKAARVSKNPRFVLNPARLTGPRGIHIIPEHFKDFKFKGKGHEKEDLDLVLKKLEHWAYRLYPKFKFQDCLKKIETLGKKRPVMVHLHKIRSDQLLTDETVVQKDSSDEEDHAAPVEQQEDEFDKLLQQQIDLAGNSPAPNSTKKHGFTTPGGNFNSANKLGLATPGVDYSTSFTMTKAVSSPSISDEQKERMIRNRQLAEERRLARIKQNSASTTDEIDLTKPAVNTNIDITKATVLNNLSDTNEIDLTNATVANNISHIDKVDLTANNVESVDLTEINAHVGRKKTEFNKEDIDLTKTLDITVDLTEEVTCIKRKHNRSNVIDSSDEECEMATVNHSITVDVHETDHLTSENNILETDHTKNIASKKNCDIISSSDDFEDITEIESVDELSVLNDIETVTSKVNANNIESNVEDILKSSANVDEELNTEVGHDEKIDKEILVNKKLDEHDNKNDEDRMDIDFTEDF